MTQPSSAPDLSVEPSNATPSVTSTMTRLLGHPEQIEALRGADQSKLPPDQRAALVEIDALQNRTLAHAQWVLPQTIDL